MPAPLFSGKVQELLKIARAQVAKQAFIDTASMGGQPPMDPAAAGGQPPMDPAAMGGAPPMDPSMGGAPPTDPSMGGAPPMDPSMMGGAPPPAGGIDPAMIKSIVDQAVQAAMGGQGGGAAGGAGGMAGGQLKPKIDVNVAIMQMSKMIARICDALSIQIPASEMIATPSDLTSMAQQQSGAGAGGQPPQSAIPPVEPMQGAFPSPGGGGGKTAADVGQSYDPGNMFKMRDRASAIATVISRNGKQHA